ncbi:MAG: TraB/GumN family protein [Sandaracinus sp.]|nr:TraB/GumN family protein [Sandaracinus sp.]
MRLLAALLLVACSSPSHPAPVFEEPAPEPAPVETVGEEVPPEPEPMATPFLYEVRTNDPDVPASYVFATLTRGLPLDRALPERLRTSLDSARVVVVAIDPNAEMNAREVQRAVLLRRGTAADLFEARVWHTLTEELQGRASIEQLRVMRPFAHLSSLVAERAKRLFPDTPEVMDFDLLAYARNRGLNVRALGTPLDEMRMLGSAPDAEAVQVTTHYVDHPEKLEAHLRALLDAYLSGDEDRVVTAVVDPDEVALAPRMHRAWQQRPAQWFRAVRREIDLGNAFVALPAGAVLGDQGVLARLRAAGRLVTRVP